MHIAFDLDDTLIPAEYRFPLEPVPKNFIRRFFCGERLRTGTPSLIRRLWSAGHIVSIYTTSFRNPFQTKLLFRAYRTRIHRMINTPIHQRNIQKLGEQYKHCTKFPPAFGIDLLIDNCLGVKGEAVRFNFSMLHIDPADDRWCDTICDFLHL